MSLDRDDLEPGAPELQKPIGQGIISLSLPASLARQPLESQELADRLDKDSVLARVRRAWGGSDPQTGELTPFKYKSQFCWDKVLMGPGHWARTQHEILIVATRCNFPPPENARLSSLYSEKRASHLAKLDYFADVIVKMGPDLPRIELFARKRQTGWEASGKQAPQDLSGSRA